eukprot:762091-Hanusia_phi.AAC.2
MLAYRAEGVIQDQQFLGSSGLSLLEFTANRPAPTILHFSSTCIFYIWFFPYMISVRLDGNTDKNKPLIRHLHYNRVLLRVLQLARGGGKREMLGERQLEWESEGGQGAAAAARGEGGARVRNRGGLTKEEDRRIPPVRNNTSRGAQDRKCRDTRNEGDFVLDTLCPLLPGSLPHVSKSAVVGNGGVG